MSNLPTTCDHGIALDQTCVQCDQLFPVNLELRGEATASSEQDAKSLEKCERIPVDRSKTVVRVSPATIKRAALVIEWAVDLLDLYDKLLIETFHEPREKVLSDTHRRGKLKAREVLRELQEIVR